MLALPCAATAGLVVRSPSSDSIGSSLISPCTVSSRCTLVWPLVVSADCFSSVAASGRFLLSSELEHPASRAHGSEEGGEDRQEAGRHDCIVVGAADLDAVAGHG